MTPYSLYIHIPFCQRRCHYCDFNTYAGRESLIQEYVDALEKEIQYLAIGAGEALPVDTLFFGGGTPSLLPPGEIHRILSALAASFELGSAIEITLEANPGTLSPAYLQDLHASGVNRLSLGVQSARPAELALLGRQHAYGDVIQAVKWARRAGFDNLSLDLIFGLPGQTLAHWEMSLTLALDLDPEHFSLYALTIEPGTPMYRWVSRGLIAPPDPDWAADMYELASERLERAGYLQYEISNWAKSSSIQRRASISSEALSPRHNLQTSILNLQSSIFNPQYACRHNLQYWHNFPYLGLGAGAHGFAGGVRTVNVRSPEVYIQRLTFDSLQAAVPFPRTPATAEVIPIDQDVEMRETMMMGLRLTREGVSRSTFQARFECTLEDVFGREIGELVDWRLLEWTGDILRLAPKGRLLGNQVFMQFV